MFRMVLLDDGCRRYVRREEARQSEDMEGKRTGQEAVNAEWGNEFDNEMEQVHHYFRFYLAIGVPKNFGKLRIQPPENLGAVIGENGLFQP